MNISTIQSPLASGAAELPTASSASATPPAAATEVKAPAADKPAKKAAAMLARPAGKKAAGKKSVSSPRVDSLAKPAPTGAVVKASASKKAAKPAKLAKPIKPGVAVKPKAKLVRDSFTMPQVDFDLVAKLKDRALAFKRPTKKSELLRAGLQVLAGLTSDGLQQALGSLAPLKAGRPKKAD